MSAAQARLEIAAENLANGSSDGFRRSIAREELHAGGVRPGAVGVLTFWDHQAREITIVGQRLGVDSSGSYYAVQ